MQTIVSLAERLDMTAEAAVEVLRKLQFDVEDVNSEITREAIDLLLDIDEDRSVLDKRLAQIELKKEQERKKLEAAEAAKAKAKAKAKPGGERRRPAEKDAARLDRRARAPI